ncbi:MAG TPA: DUF721 domain-containing protein [Kofleriaceae bacterium]|nr:DUF721 domain-containing protein [Kofleriaceae bacterium]
MKRPPRALAVTTAGDAVRAALEFRGLADDVRGERVIAEWTELVGPRIAQRTRPDRIAERVLWIEVATAAWLHELNHLRPQLLRGLSERLGEPALFDDLRLRLASGGRRDRAIVPRGRRAAPAPPRPAVRPATGAAREAIVREVAAVDDEELRELIARVRITNDR